MIAEEKQKDIEALNNVIIQANADKSHAENELKLANTFINNIQQMFK